LVVGFQLAQCNAAPFRRGDVLVNHYLPANIQQFRNGTLIETYPGGGGNTIWEGVGLLPDGRIVTTFRGPVTSGNEFRQGGLRFFSPDGTTTSMVRSVLNFPGDVSVFRDGTIAVSNQGDHSIELFSPAGAHLRTISHSVFDGDGAPFGTSIGRDNTIWVAGGDSTTIQHFAKDGTWLGGFSAAAIVGDLVVDPVDGSLWLPDRNGNTVFHYSTSGVQLSSFPTSVPTGIERFEGIGIGADGVIHVISNNSNRVYQYSRSGQPLRSFSVPIGLSTPLFLTVVNVPEPGTILLLALAAFAWPCRYSRKGVRNLFVTWS
jgi:DNA-binding beta-propeller fold protein YncE